MSKDDNGHTPKDSHYARLRRAHRDRVREDDRAAGRGGSDEDVVRLYGLHTVAAALANPKRKLLRLQVTRNALQRMEIDPAALRVPHEIVEPRALDRLVGDDAVHQGAVLETRPLSTKKLGALTDSDLILVLDQVTDPHNVGAILRSAVAFKAGALVTTSRHSPQESGVLAKAASGALELIPYIQVTNLADALTEIAGLGYRTVGLDSDGEQEVEAHLDAPKLALVLGAEGKGLRQKTRETVDVLARLDMPGAIRSLNVSNAAAISLYAARRRLG
jgi:23S rRNA (guanosine2251-2'-O)-methyltransferase